MSLTNRDASRFLTRATFGPTKESIEHLTSIGIDAWLNEQFQETFPTHLEEYIRIHEIRGGTQENRNYRRNAFWGRALWGKDQLRQRLTYALSQILVTSEQDDGININQQARGLANYYDIFANNAFGNYRDILQEVTLSPVMGIYLTMAGNKKEDEVTGAEPDQNFAREVMQLFTMGEFKKAFDGTVIYDDKGIPVPKYDENDIMELARVFTGFDVQENDDFLLNEMTFNEEDHDFGSKVLLGSYIPAGLSPLEDVTYALDILYAQRETAVYVAQSLIKFFVTSNPSKGYVQRVALAFDENGKGDRGDLKHVITAILTDQDCLSETAHIGKLKEPLLAFSGALRAMEVYQGQDYPHYRDTTIGFTYDEQVPQGVLQAESVFNYFEQDFIPNGPLGTRGMIGPEFQIFTPHNFTVIANHLKRVLDRVRHSDDSGDRDDRIYMKAHRLEEAMLKGEEEYYQEVADIFFNGEMSEQVRDVLADCYTTNTNKGRIRDHIKSTVWLAAITPDFSIQK
ncbi:conserved hypothetical protein [Vibrio chagasii]|nr:conserved hypothetical protein [Vibrio chagasii]CAH7190054.1 conserved hypothetical protein [Vibrio chagasii]CAH7223445.1 conserved hypothetical protein [Vibrio chagasii]CAH7320767.1 conserved hypothetical protein [Vibrio chagasii]